MQKFSDVELPHTRRPKPSTKFVPYVDESGCRYRGVGNPQFRQLTSRQRRSLAAVELSYGNHEPRAPALLTGEDPRLVIWDGSSSRAKQAEEYNPLGDGQRELTQVFFTLDRRSDGEVLRFYRRYGPIGGCYGDDTSWWRRLQRERGPFPLNCEPLWLVKREAQRLRMLWHIVQIIPVGSASGLQAFLGPLEGTPAENKAKHYRAGVPIGPEHASGPPSGAGFAWYLKVTECDCGRDHGPGTCLRMMRRLWGCGASWPATDDEYLAAAYQVAVDGWAQGLRDVRVEARAVLPPSLRRSLGSARTRGLAELLKVAQYEPPSTKHHPAAFLPRFTIAWQPTTLLAAIYCNLLDVAMTRYRLLDWCSGCGRPFPQIGRRRHYCSDSCRRNQKTRRRTENELQWLERLLEWFSGN